MPDIKKYLNRDGLDEYNSLLPHSSAEMQDYVDDWLDAHPEATTTVQDGAISEPKLADKSVSLRTLADDTVHMLKGMMLTKEISGNALSADDAYSAPPVALTIEGKSTQDGTPTPDAPVEIVSLEQTNLRFAGKNLISTSGWLNGSIDIDGTPVTNTHRIRSTYISVAPATYTLSCASNWLVRIINCYDSEQVFIERFYSTNGDAVTATLPNNTAYVRIVAGIDNTTVISAADVTNARPQLEVGSTATSYQPYAATNVLLNLTQALRSLSDGTHDALSFAYLRPSTREGWAWYTRELVQRVSTMTLDGSNVSGKTSGRFYFRNDAIERRRSYALLCDSLIGYPSHTSIGGTSASNFVQGVSAFTDATGYDGQNWVYIAVLDCMSYTVAEMRTWMAEHPMEVMYPLATPTTTTLDPIELPVLPAPNVTVWADPSTGLQMEYVRNANIVIQSIEQAIADQ